MLELLAASALLLAGLDCYLTFSRMRKYGPRVELNPLVSQLAADFGLTTATIFLGAQNLAIICGVYLWANQVVMAVVVGLKLGLAMMQLKSLQLERILERLLEIKRKP